MVGQACLDDGRKPRRRTATRRRQAFTLVELLVVIAILALLLTLLMPSLRRASMLARAAMCGTNLRGIHVGIRLYAEDNEQFFPGARYGTEFIAFGYDQVSMTLPGQVCPRYVPHPETFWCPAESRVLNGAPHPFFEAEGGYFDKMKYETYKVGSAEWASNEGNRRLAWGTMGSTYAVPMSTPWRVGGPVGAGEYLTQHPNWSWNGAVDPPSVDRNPEALYLVDKQQGIHLYLPEQMSSRHEKVNYLNFGGAVKREAVEALVEACYAGEKPWVFRWEGPSPWAASR